MSGTVFISTVPELLINLMVMAFGLVVGSFLNVVIHRLPRGESIVHPGSHCPGCGKAIRAWQNVPVFSYLILRGRCASCRTPISVRYPVVELLTGILFLAVKVKFGLHWSLMFRDFPFVAALVAITFIDLDHRIIPDELSLGGLLLGLATCWMDPQMGWISSFSGAILGFTFFYLIAVGYEKLSGRSGLGGGDIKLIAMLGSFVGPTGVLTTILVSTITGSIVGVAWAAATKQKTVMGSSVPFGPFLVMGALVAYLVGELPFLYPPL